MRTTPAQRWILSTAVLALLASPVMLLFFFDRPLGLALAAGLFLYGAIALWRGLRGLEGSD